MQAPDEKRKLVTQISTMPAPIRSLPPPSKKRKLHQDSAFTQSVVRLEADLTSAVSNNASLNSLADLLDLTLRSKNSQDTSKAIYALYRVFVLVINSDKLGLSGDDAAKVVKAWLWERLNAYVEYLGGLLKDEEKTLRVSSMPWFQRNSPISGLDLSLPNFVLVTKTSLDSLYQVLPIPTPISYLPLQEDRGFSPPLSAIYTAANGAIIPS